MTKISLIIALSAFLGVVLGGIGLSTFTHMPIVTGMTRTDFWIIFLVLILPLYGRFGVFNSVDVPYILHTHWGDLVGLALIAVGVAITLVTPYLFKTDTVTIIGVTRTGDGLIGAGLMALKLKSTPLENGNRLENKDRLPNGDGK